MSRINANLPPGTSVPVLMAKGNKRGGRQNRNDPHEEEEGDNNQERQEAPKTQIVVGHVSNPKPFNGNEDQDVNEWITHFKAMSLANGWDEEKMLARIFLFLEGTAKNWLQGKYADAEPDDIEEFFADLKEAFENSKPEINNQYKLDHRKQHLGENPAHYAYHKLKLCAMVDRRMKEKDKIFQILKGLQPVYAEAVYEKDFADVDSLIRALKARHESRTNHPSNFAMNSIDPQASYSGFQNQRQGNRDYALTLRQERMRKGLCFKCGKSGHISKQCVQRFSKPSASPDSNTDPQGNGQRGGLSRN